MCQTSGALTPAFSLAEEHTASRTASARIPLAPDDGVDRFSPNYPIWPTRGKWTWTILQAAAALVSPWLQPQLASRSKEHIYNMITEVGADPRLLQLKIVSSVGRFPSINFVRIRPLKQREIRTPTIAHICYVF
jgi:hypothetical protein